jgi:fermentation-respiration switch protein FrsA (DUF1100 family)
MTDDARRFPAPDAHEGGQLPRVSAGDALTGVWRLASGAKNVSLLPVAATATYLAAHPPRRRPRRTPAALGLDYVEVRFSALDGTRLAGWWVPNAAPARGAVILCHGYACNREQPLPLLPALLQAGYHGFLFDFRAHGESAGRQCGIGHAEVADLLGAVAWLERRLSAPGALPIAALGFSMGGAVSILAAAQTSRIRAVIGDSVFPSLEQAVERRGRLLFGPLSPLIQPPVQRVWRRLHQAEPDAVSPEAAIASLSPRPVLLVHCERDIYLDERDLRALYDRAGDPRELWRVPGALHMGAVRRSPHEYVQRVLSFLRRHGL